MSSINKQILEAIKEKEDIKFKKFNSSLIPTVDDSRIIGVKTPELKKIASEYSKNPEISFFLEDLPHRYFEQNQVHAFIISKIKDYDSCIAEINRFLPYVDNWATCDQLCPVSLSKNREDLIIQIKKWIGSEKVYTVRFAIKMLMTFFLGEHFDKAFPDMVMKVDSSDYYVNMMAAWYFATALVKNRDEILPYLYENRLNEWVHNKTIQKAVESFRVSPEDKILLKSLKR